jgi:hypothetical protein
MSRQAAGRMRAASAGRARTATALASFDTNGIGSPAGVPKKGPDHQNSRHLSGVVDWPAVQAQLSSGPYGQ